MTPSSYMLNGNQFGNSESSTGSAAVASHVHLAHRRQVEARQRPAFTIPPFDKIQRRAPLIGSSPARIPVSFSAKYVSIVVER